VNKQKVGFIGRTEATCSYIEHQLAGFLGQYVGVLIWCLSHQQVPPPDFESTDIFVCSNQTVLDSVRSYLPPGKPVLKANRIISTVALDKLFDLEPNRRVLVVGTTGETADNSKQPGVQAFRVFSLLPRDVGRVA